MVISCPSKDAPECQPDLFSYSMVVAFLESNLLSADLIFFSSKLYQTTLTVQIQIACFYVFQYLFAISAVYRRLPCDKHEQDDPQRPNITSLVVFSHKNLRRHVICSTSERSFFDFEFLPHIFFPSKTQSEIDKHELHLLLSHEQKVLGFKIAMCDFVVVAVLNDSYHLVEQVSCFELGKAILFLTEGLEQLAALADAVS